jgi:hypothetical protein
LLLESRRSVCFCCTATALRASSLQSVLHNTTANTPPHRYHPADIPTHTPPSPNPHNNPRQYDSGSANSNIVPAPACAQIVGRPVSRRYNMPAHFQTSAISYPMQKIGASSDVIRITVASKLKRAPILPRFINAVPPCSTPHNMQHPYANGASFCAVPASPAPKALLPSVAAA